jgi:hypothetical protein
MRVKVRKTLAYYGTELITALKSFIVNASVVDVIKLFSLSLTAWPVRLGIDLGKTF